MTAAERELTPPAPRDRSSAPPRVWAVWWAVCFVWSTVWLVIKVGVSTVPPLSFAAVRLLIAVMIVTPIAWRLGRLHVAGGRDRTLLVVTGLLLLALNYGLLFWGTQFLPSGLVAVLQAGTPGIGLLLAWSLGRERITAAKVAGLAAGIAGVFLIFMRQGVRVESSARIACIAVLLSAVCVAAAYVLMKDRGEHLHPVTVMVWQMWAAALPMLALALWLDGSPLELPWSPRSLVAVLYLALVGSLAAFWVNYWLLQRIDASALLFMGIVEAPLAAGLGALVLGERLDAATYAGATMVLLAAAVIVREQAQERG
jgi:drug/metabolite transporter (DMT)-like permease